VRRGHESANEVVIPGAPQCDDRREVELIDLLPQLWHQRTVADNIVAQVIVSLRGSGDGGQGIFQALFLYKSTHAKNSYRFARLQPSVDERKIIQAQAHSCYVQFGGQAAELHQLQLGVVTDCRDRVGLIK
jgi:hypothetical protein